MKSEKTLVYSVPSCSRRNCQKTLHKEAIEQFPSLFGDPIGDSRVGKELRQGRQQFWRGGWPAASRRGLIFQKGDGLFMGGKFPLKGNQTLLIPVAEPKVKVSITR